MKSSQAHYLLRQPPGLKFGSTGKFTLAPKDLEAAEVLGKALTGSAGRVDIEALGADLMSDDSEDDGYVPSSDKCSDD